MMSSEGRHQGSRQLHYVEHQGNPLIIRGKFERQQGKAVQEWTSPLSRQMPNKYKFSDIRPMKTPLDALKTLQIDNDYVATDGFRRVYVLHLSEILETTATQKWCFQTYGLMKGVNGRLHCPEHQEFRGEIE
jgi:hypothetical protein